MNNDLKYSYKKCRDIFKYHAKTYYYGAVLFEKKKFYHICAFYGFVRLIDNLIDENQEISLLNKKEILDDIENIFFMYYDDYKKYKKQVNLSYIYKDNKFYFKFFEILPAVLTTFDKININERCIRSFFSSMRMDLEKFRYKNFKELEEYMFGSAEIIGEVMYSIMEEKEEDYLMLDYAYSLGKAFQLTNFIRDIREDYEMIPRRIYIPEEEQEQFNVNLEKDIPKILDNSIEYTKLLNVKELIKYQIERCDKIYEFAEVGINKLKDLKPIYLSKVLYQSIHKKIIKNNYDVFSNRCHLSKWEKIIMAYNILGIQNMFLFIYNYFRYTYF